MKTKKIRYHNSINKLPSNKDNKTSATIDSRTRQRAFCITILPPKIKHNGSGELTELKELLLTAGVATVGELTQQRFKPDPNTYLGKGKLDELQQAIITANADLLVCDDELSARQERNLEEHLGLPVIDRTAVILDIFADHAISAEGKLQVELAQLEYNLARMRGLWPHLERLGGGIGTRGPGEQQIETDRRLARNQIAHLRRRLKKIVQRRQLMRKNRKESQYPTIALAGYTNTGKSTLLNALTSAEVQVSKKLFQTLDPTTRTFRHKGRSYLLTDTVGFTRKLPHQLIEAFKATLEETRIADFILHIADASLPDEELQRMISIVDSVLREIEADTQPRLLVLNKADLLSEDDRRQLRIKYPKAILFSALKEEGLNTLCQRMASILSDQMQTVELLIPYKQSKILEQLYQLAGDLHREDTAKGVHIQARVPPALADRLSSFDLNS